MVKASIISSVYILLSKITGLRKESLYEEVLGVDKILTISNE